MKTTKIIVTGVEGLSLVLSLAVSQQKFINSHRPSIDLSFGCFDVSFCVSSMYCCFRFESLWICTFVASHFLWEHETLIFSHCVSQLISSFLSPPSLNPPPPQTSLFIHVLNHLLYRSKQWSEQWKGDAKQNICAHTGEAGPEYSAKYGNLNQTTLPCRHRVRNSSPGGLRREHTPHNSFFF